MGVVLTCVQCLQTGQPQSHNIGKLEGMEQGAVGVDGRKKVKCKLTKVLAK